MTNKTIDELVNLVEEAYKAKQEKWLKGLNITLPDIPQELMLNVAKELVRFQKRYGRSFREVIIDHLTVYTKVEALQTFENIKDLINNPKYPDIYLSLFPYVTATEKYFGKTFVVSTTEVRTEIITRVYRVKAKTKGKAEDNFQDGDCELVETKVNPERCKEEINDIFENTDI